MLKQLWKIQIKGRVQGVYYRGSTKAKADELGLCGWVKNLPNGDVQVEVEGSPEQLQHFLKWCQSGPPMARVEQVEQTEAALKHYDNFTILR